MRSPDVYLQTVLTKLLLLCHNCSYATRSHALLIVAYHIGRSESPDANAEQPFAPTDVKVSHLHCCT